MKDKSDAKPEKKKNEADMIDDIEPEDKALKLADPNHPIQ